VERRKQEERFIPNVEGRKESYAPSFLYLFFFLYGFFFLMLEKKKMPRKKRSK
jgi:hypothetical protein